MESFVGIIKKGIVVFLCCCCIFTTVACGKKKAEVNPNSTGQTGQAAETKAEGGAGTITEASALSADIELVGADSAYFTVKSLDSIFENGENQTSYVLNIAASESGAAIHMNINDVPENWEDEIIYRDVIFIMNEQGEVASEFIIQEIIPEDISLGSMQFDKDGNLILIASRPYNESEQVSDIWIYKLSPQGELLGNKIVLTPPENGGRHIGYYGVVFDSQGYLIANGFKEEAVSNGMPVMFVTVLDENGDELFTIEDESSSPQDAWTFGTEMRTDGLKAYIGVSPALMYGVDEDVFYHYIHPIDVEGQKLGEALKGAGSGMNLTQVQSGDGGLYFNDYVGIYRILPEEDTVETIFLWKDIDTDFTSGFTDEVVVLSKNRILINRLETDEYISRWYMLEKQESNPNAGKKILKIGGYQIAGDDKLKKAIYLFNQSNSDVRAEIFDYAETKGDAILFNDQIKAMNMAILSGEAPDVLYEVTHWHGDSRLTQYANQEILVDLKEKIDGDSQFVISDYLENVILTTENDGHMYKLILDFCLPVYSGKYSLIGEQKSWTIDELNTFSTMLPEDLSLFSEDKSSESLLRDIMSTSQNIFINWAEKKVDFNTPEFQKVLEFAKANGISRAKMEFEMNNGMMMWSPTPSALQSGRIVSSMRDLYSYGSELDSFTSYPAVQESKMLCQPISSVAVFASTPQSDMGWEFVKLLLSDEVQSVNSDGIPIRKSALEKSIASKKQMLAEELEWQMQYAMESGGGGASMPVGNSMHGQSLDDMEIAFNEMISSINGVLYLDDGVWRVIEEETQAFFADQKTAEDVADIIQRRVTTLVNER